MKIKEYETQIGDHPASQITNKSLTQYSKIDATCIQNTLELRMP